MGTTVVGIFPKNSHLQELASSLSSAGHELHRLRVISPDGAPPELADSGIRFLEATQDEIGSAIGGIMTSWGGTGVPGVTSSSPAEPALRTTLEESLEELSIPGSRVEDFAKAVEAGRTVASIKADPDEIETVKKAFQDAGATIVEVFS
jgi:hypothetical protein